MVDFSKYHLLGQLLLGPSMQQPPATAQQLQPVNLGTSRASGVRFDIHPVVQNPPVVHVTPPTEVYDRSPSRLEVSVSAGTANIQQNFEFNPFQTYYRNVSAQVGYFHSLWRRGTFWEGAVGGMLRGSVSWGDYHNNGSYAAGGYLCAAARQSLPHLENFIGFDVSAYGCLGVVYSELNFGRSAEHRQPTPALGINAMLGVEGALSFVPRNRFSPALTVGYWRVLNLAQSTQLDGAVPVTYHDEVVQFGLRMTYDPQPTRFPVPVDQSDLADARAAVRVARQNYQSLDDAVREGLSDQPTQADFDQQIEALNEADRTLCISQHTFALWPNHQAPLPRFRFQFFPGQYQVPTLRVQTLSQRAESVSERNPALDAIADEMLRSPELYFILDGYSAAGSNHEQDVRRSADRIQSVLRYFQRVYPRLSERLVVDDQSAHGSDISAIVRSPAGDASYYGNNAVTFTQSPVNSRTPYDCVPQREDHEGQDPHRPVRTHWVFQPASH